MSLQLQVCFLLDKDAIRECLRETEREHTQILHSEETVDDSYFPSGHNVQFFAVPVGYTNLKIC